MLQNAPRQQKKRSKRLRQNTTKKFESSTGSLVEKQIGELKLKQQQESLANQQTQMGSLQAQLDEAKRQVQDIAVKAIEGASGAKALSQINQIAMEQAKNRMPN